MNSIFLSKHLKKLIISISAACAFSPCIASPFQVLPIPELIEQLNQEFPGMPFECVDMAATHRQIPHAVLYGFLSIERGADRKGRPLTTPIKTKDGQILGFSIGWFQINEVFLRDNRLIMSGINRNDLYNPCTNADVASYIVEQCKNKYPGAWGEVLDNVIKCYHRPRKTTETDFRVRQTYLEMFRVKYAQMESRILKRSRSPM